MAATLPKLTSSLSARSSSFSFPAARRQRLLAPQSLSSQTRRRTVSSVLTMPAAATTQAARRATAPAPAPGVYKKIETALAERNLPTTKKPTGL